MVTDKTRMIEWLRRSAEQVHQLRRKPRLSKEKCLLTIRQSYSVIAVLTKVAKRDAYLLGIAPPNDSLKS